MLSSKTLLVLVVVVLAGVAMGYKLSNEEAQFRDYMVKFGKIYKTEEEFSVRYSTFLETLHRIEMKNAIEGPEGAHYGLNKFSDWSVEEFRHKRLGYRPSGEHFRKFARPVEESDRAPSGTVPDSFNWRSKDVVTPIKDQGDCGSCWAESATEGIESAWAMAGNNLTSLAVQQLVDCDTADYGCDGGDLPEAFAYATKAGGLEGERDYPYTARDGKCKFDKSKVKASMKSWKYATQKRNETEMQEVSYVSGPLSICVDAEAWMDYNSGVITKNCGKNLDHCVQIVGWDVKSSTKYWVVRNSWGGDWGENGDVWVAIGKNLCGVAEEATFVQA